MRSATLFGYFQPRVIGFTLSLLILSSAAPAAATLAQIKGEYSDIFVRADAGDRVKFTFHYAFGEEKDRMQLLGFGPDGNRAIEYEAPYVQYGSSIITFPLAQAGDWRFTPLRAGERLSVEALDGSPVALQPKIPQRPIMKLGSGETVTLYFNVPVGAAGFTVHASSVGGVAGSVEIHDSNGGTVATIGLPQFNSATGAGYDETCAVDNPSPGVWSIELRTDSTGYLGFWLTGIPNYFSASQGELFVPAFPQASAAVSIDARQTEDISDVCIGAYGGNWNIPPGEVQTITNRFKEMGLNFSRPHAHIAQIESSNDNGDPADINWPALDLYSLYHTMELTQNGYQAQSIVTFYHRDCDWLGDAFQSWTDARRDEFAEFCLACVIYLEAPDLIPGAPYPHGPYDIRWYECMNEPNWTGDEHDPGLVAAYADIFSRVIARIRAHPDTRVNGVKVGGPCIASWHAQKNNCPAWIGSLVEAVGYEANPIIWHAYDWHSLQHKDDFRLDIDRIKQEVQAKGYNPDNFDYVITENNVHGGIPSNQEMQDTQYASLWLTNALLYSLKGGIDGWIYYSLHDDTDRAKGLMWGNDSCYGPGRASYYCNASGTEPYQLKPAGIAVKAFMDNLLSRKAGSSSSHSQVGEFATVDEQNGLIKVILTNIESGRGIEIALNVTLPSSMRNSTYSVTVSVIDENNPELTQLSQETVSAATHLQYNFTAGGWSIYFVSFERTAPTPTPTPFTAKINFQPLDSQAPIGYLRDCGQPYGNQGEREYGWR